MDEKFVNEQEKKAGEFDMKLAEDTINALEKKWMNWLSSSHCRVQIALRANVVKRQ